jgi:DNA (cytosine-5)-methyltransferase 1
MYLTKAGFNKGDKISVKYNADTIVISKEDNGEKIVSGKKTPLIDINNSKILQVFKIADKIQVIVEIGKIIISKTKIAIRKLTALKDGSLGDVFSGGGLLTKAMELAGLKSKWAIEKNPKYAETWQINHEGIMYNSDIAEIDFDKLERVEVIAGGIPCENFSVARQNKDIEAETMDLSMYFMMLVEKLNPRTIILEEVPLYIKSEIGVATFNALKRLGYNVESKVFSGNDYGEIQNRQRVIIIASYDKITFPEEFPFTGTAKDILLDPDNPECKWFTPEEKSWIFEHWENQAKKGNGFKAQIITEETTSIQAITKRYQAIQQQNPLVKHPTENKYRLFTIAETKKLMGLPQNYDLGEFPTYAGEVLGQGVLVKVFKLFAETMRIPEIITNKIKEKGLDLFL